MFKIVITKYKQGENTLVQRTREGFKTEKAAQKKVKELEKVYADGRFTFYGFDILAA